MCGGMRSEDFDSLADMFQEAVQLDGDVLFGLTKKTSPTVYKHMVWFTCYFLDNTVISFS